MKDVLPVMVFIGILLCFPAFIVLAGWGFFDWVEKKWKAARSSSDPYQKSGVLCICGCDKSDHPFHLDGYGSCWNSDPEYGTCGCKGYEEHPTLNWKPSSGAPPGTLPPPGGIWVDNEPVLTTSEQPKPINLHFPYGGVKIPADAIGPTHIVVPIAHKAKEIAGPLQEKRTILLDDEEG